MLKISSTGVTWTYHTCENHIKITQTVSKYKQTDTYWQSGAYNTQQMHLSVQYWRMMDLETKILNVIPYTSSDKIVNLTLRFESDLTIFVQILEVSPHINFSTISSQCNCTDSSYLISTIFVTLPFCLFLYIFFVVSIITVSIMEFLYTVPNISFESEI